MKPMLAVAMIVPCALGRVIPMLGRALRRVRGGAIVAAALGAVAFRPLARRAAV
jgi:hypothetical protein